MSVPVQGQVQGLAGGGRIATTGVAQGQHLLETNSGLRHGAVQPHRRWSNMGTSPFSGRRQPSLHAHRHVTGIAVRTLALWYGIARSCGPYRLACQGNRILIGDVALGHRTDLRKAGTRPRSREHTPKAASRPSASGPVGVEVGLSAGSPVSMVRGGPDPGLLLLSWPWAPA